MKRIILIVGILLVLFVAGVVVFLLMGLGPAIKRAVETVGSRATGTAVTLKSAEVSLTSGEGRLTGLVVGNPKDYKTSSAVELGDIRVKLDTSTVTSDVIVVNEVVIEAPQITYEVGPGGSNIGVIQNNVDAFSNSLTSGGKPSAGANPADKGGTAGGEKANKGGGGKKFIIKDLVIRAGRIEVSATLLKGQKVGATLAEIHIKNLGNAEGGATTAEIAQAVLGSITDGVITSVKNLGIDALKGSFDTVTKSLGDKLKSLFGK